MENRGRTADDSNKSPAKNCTWDAIIKNWQNGELFDQDHFQEHKAECQKEQAKPEPKAKG